MSFCQSQELPGDFELLVRSFELAEKRLKADGIEGGTGHDLVERFWCCDGSGHRIVVPFGHPFRSQLDIGIVVRADDLLPSKRSQRRAQFGPFSIQRVALDLVLFFGLVIFRLHGVNIIVGPACGINR